MSQFPNRAALWLNKLAPDAPLMSGLCPSVRWQTARLMAKRAFYRRGPGC